MRVKSVNILIEDIKSALSSLNIDSFVSEFKCFSEELDKRALLDLIKTDEKFEVEIYYSEPIPEDKNKELFLMKIEEIKKCMDEEDRLIVSCGWVDVTSEKVETSKNCFIEKITLTGERR